MPTNYANIEAEVIQMLLSGFSDRLDENRCVAGDIDRAFNALKGEQPDVVTDAVIVDFAGGTNRPRQTIGNINWAWVISGIYMIRYHKGIEDVLRSTVSRIPQLLQENPRLNGTTPLAYITEIGDPIIGKLNDVSFYFIPFFIEALDQSIRGV